MFSRQANYAKERELIYHKNLMENDLACKLEIKYKGQTHTVFLSPIDLEWATKYQWSLLHGYAVRRDKEKRRHLIGMHREIMQRILGQNFKEQVDHIDRNRLNNCRHNLRLATHQENVMNSGLRSNNKSSVTGVYRRSSSKKWIVRIGINHKVVSLGVYEKKDDAVRVRLEAEKQFFKEFAPQTTKLADLIGKESEALWNNFEEKKKKRPEKRKGPKSGYRGVV